MTKGACLVLPVIFLLSCTSKNETKNPDELHRKKDTTITTPGSNPYAVIDLSPMDMSYFPVDYSKRKMAKDLNTPPIIRVIYSRPHRQGRVIFGNLLKYGERW